MLKKEGGFINKAAGVSLRMLVLSVPASQSRLNACVYDQLDMRIDGDVVIPGAWDSYDTLDYLEKRLKQSVIATLKDDGSAFVVRGKLVCFLAESVIVSHSAL
jgi:hypothetical protein